MNNWVIINSFHKVIFNIDLAVIDLWNDILFLYSKISNDKKVYQKNYLFFVSSTNSPFSREEILDCLDFTFEMLNDDEFIKSLTKEDKIKFYDLFSEIKSKTIHDQSDNFSTSIIYS